MQINIQTTNLTKRKISHVYIGRIARKAVQFSEKRFSKVDISIVLTNKKNIRELNRAYRKKDRPTDVLSFNYSLGYNRKKEIEGELFLCPAFIAESARENTVSFEKELGFVLSHGIFHLLGMRHGKRMYELQDKVIGDL